MRVAIATLLLGGLAHGCSKGDVAPPAETHAAPAAAVQPPPPPPPSGSVTHKMFARDVPTDTLALSIGIETLGGVSTALIPRGTKLPTSITETFSTAMDNQPSVEVHIVQGERPMAVNNRSLGKFQLFGIPPAGRGIPQIAVTFAIDAGGVLTVSALDLATKAHREVRIEGALSGALDQAAVARILAETDAAKSEDLQHSAWSEARNQLDTLIYSTRKLLAETGAQLSPAMRKTAEQALTRAEAMFAATTSPGDPELLRTAKASLEKAVHAAAEELYRTAK